MPPIERQEIVSDAQGAAGKRPRRAGSRKQRARLRAIRPLLRFRARKAAGQEPAVLLPSGDEITSWNQLIFYRARQVRVSVSTLYEWLRRFERSGFAGLAESPRADKGTFRKFENCPVGVSFVFDKGTGGQNAASITRALSRIWPNISGDGSPPPTYPTVRSLLKSLGLAHPRRTPSKRSEKVHPWPR